MQQEPNIQKWHPNPTVKAWKEHIEIVLGYQDGVSHIGTYSWTVTIHDKLCKGEPAFGIKGTNAAEALLQVIKERTPDKYAAALKGLRTVILEERAKGASLKKLGLMWERISGKSLE